MDDRALVAAITRGDAGGLDGAYRRYADRLYAYCAALLHDRDAAADAVQETFLKAARHADQLRDPDRLRAWLYSVARRECLRILRSRTRSVPLELAGEVPAETADPVAGVHAEQIRELIRSAADGLGDLDREIIELSVRHGLAPAEVANALGISANHAHARLSRARSHLLRSLGAILLARSAESGCPDLQELVRGWNGRLDPLLRKRISRHADGCPRCDDNLRARLQPAALLTSYAGLPLLPAPSWLLRPPTTGGGQAGPPDGPRDGPPDGPPRIRASTADPAEPKVGPAGGVTAPDRSARRWTAAAAVAAALLLIACVATVLPRVVPVQRSDAAAFTAGTSAGAGAPTTPATAAAAPVDGEPPVAAPSGGATDPNGAGSSSQPGGPGPSGQPGGPGGKTPGDGSPPARGSASPSRGPAGPRLVTAFSVTARPTVSCDRAAAYRLSVTVSGSATLRQAVLYWQGSSQRRAAMTVSGSKATHQVPGLHGTITWWVQAEAADGRTYTTARATAVDPC